MNHKQFADVFARQIESCERVLVQKASEYADDVDRLRNFKISAALQECTPREALGGMMSKHTVSIYDMIGSEAEFVVALWDEKITDHINYLILLKAVVSESISDREDADQPRLEFDTNHAPVNIS